MAIRDILVNLDAGPAGAARLDLAATLAARLSAHLVGLHVIDIPLPTFAGADLGGGAVIADVIQRMYDDAAAAAKPVENAFRDRLRRDGLLGEWRQVEGNLSRQITLHGRYADLIVLGQTDPQAPGPAGDAAIEAALFETGRPVLLVPYAGGPWGLGGAALVAWNARREAASAGHDALPLVAAIQAVTVLTIAPDPGADGHGEQPGADIATHLARHGLRVAVRSTAAKDVSVGEILLNEAADLGAGLLVMGGYGHSRLRELVLGGATRTILGGMTLPVLMSH